MDDKEFQSIIQRLKANDPELTELNLEYEGLTPIQIKMLAEALQSNTSLTDLNLMGNNIGDEGIMILAEALQDNTTLFSLNLSETKIRSKGIKFFAKAVLKNNMLSSLAVANIIIGDEGALALAEVFQNNSSLVSVQFSRPMTKTLAASFKNHKNLFDAGFHKKSSRLTKLLYKNKEIARQYASQLSSSAVSFEFSQLEDLWERRFAVTFHLLDYPYNMELKEARKLILKATALIEKSPHDAIQFGDLDSIIGKLQETNQRFTPEFLTDQKTPGGPRIIDLIASQGRLSEVFNWEHMAGQHVAMYKIWQTLSEKAQQQVLGMEAMMTTLNNIELARANEPSIKISPPLHTNKDSVKESLGRHTARSITHTTFPPARGT